MKEDQEALTSIEGDANSLNTLVHSYVALAELNVKEVSLYEFEFIKDSMKRLCGLINDKVIMQDKIIGE